MRAVAKWVWIMVLVLGVAALAMGAIFVYQGVSVNNLVTERMMQEKVTFGIDPSLVAKGEVIHTADEAMHAADVIKEHRHAIAPTYQDLLAASGGKFDPTNPMDATYAQAINMENYLYLGVLAFGVAQIAIASGVFMLIMGIALLGIGLVLRLALPASPPGRGGTG